MDRDLAAELLVGTRLDGGKGDQRRALGFRPIDEPAVIGKVGAGEVVADLLHGHVYVTEVVQVDGRDQVEQEWRVVDDGTANAAAASRAARWGRSVLAAHMTKPHTTTPR